MYLLYRFFNSVIFMILNLTMALYTCKRFFRVMKSHYKLVAEIARFNAIVCQSRASLDYINRKVSEAMKQIEGDIGKELYITHNLTKISSKMGMILRRFNALEERVIEIVRMEYNTESIKLETPSDISIEVKKVLVAAKKKDQHDSYENSKTSKKSKLSASTNKGVNKRPLNLSTKFSAVPPVRGKFNVLEASHSEIPRSENRQARTIRS